ncbi:MAG: hypothetical protein PVI78_10555 [Anaerolineales bacterium]
MINRRAIQCGDGAAIVGLLNRDPDIVEPSGPAIVELALDLDFIRRSLA